MTNWMAVFGRQAQLDGKHMDEKKNGRRTFGRTKIIGRKQMDEQITTKRKLDKNMDEQKHA